MYSGWVLPKERRHWGERRVSNVIFGWEAARAVDSSLRLEMNWM